MSSKVWVHKFGGACFKDKSSFQLSIKIINDLEKPCIVIPSAFFGVTDKLHSLLKLVSPQKIKRELRTLKSFHLEITGLEGSAITVKLMNRLISELEKLLTGIALTGEVNPRIRDYVLSFGERFSALCIQRSLRSNPPVVDPSIILRTNGIFYEATVNIEESYLLVEKHLLPLIEKTSTIIIPGYYGSDEEGNITLLGRSGTDYAAAAIAHLVNADSLSIWKEVPAFMTADPKIIPEAEPLEYLDYESSGLLTLFGAKLIHPKALDLVQSKNIPLYIRHLLEPKNYTHIGQKIGNSISKPVLSYKQGLVLATIYTASLSNGAFVIEYLERSFEENGIPIYAAILIGSKLNLLLEENHRDMLFTFLQSIGHVKTEFQPTAAILVMGCDSSVLKNFPRFEDFAMLLVPDLEGILFLISPEASFSTVRKIYSLLYSKFS